MGRQDRGIAVTSLISTEVNRAADDRILRQDDAGGVVDVCCVGVAAGDADTQQRVILRFDADRDARAGCFRLTGCATGLTATCRPKCCARWRGLLATAIVFVMKGMMMGCRRARAVHRFRRTGGCPGPRGF